eukprot:312743_1
MSLIIIIAISYITFTKSQCDFTVCNPTLAPNTNCGGQPQVEWSCSGFEHYCNNEESECSACCRADWLFLNDISGGYYNLPQQLFDAQCQQDDCTTADPTNNPSNNPSVTPSNNPSVTPSVPSNM